MLHIRCVTQCVCACVTVCVLWLVNFDVDFCSNSDQRELPGDNREGIKVCTEFFFREWSDVKCMTCTWSLFRQMTQVQKKTKFINTIINANIRIILKHIKRIRHIRP